MAVYNMRNAHHRLLSSSRERRCHTEQDEVYDRNEIFDTRKDGMLPMRKRHRQFLNHSSCKGFNMLTNQSAVPEQG